MFCAYSPRMLIYWQSSSILFQVGAVVAYFLKESGSGYGLLFEPSWHSFSYSTTTQGSIWLFSDFEGL